MSYEVTEGYTLPYPDSTQGPLLLRTVWVLLSISSVVVLGRIYSKVRKTRRLYWDDVLMLGALVRASRQKSWLPLTQRAGVWIRTRYHYYHRCSVWPWQAYGIPDF